MRVGRWCLLFPFAGVEFLEAFAAEQFEFLVRLLQLLVNQRLVAAVALAHCVLLVRLVPLRVAMDRVQPAAGRSRRLARTALTRACSPRSCVRCPPAFDAGRLRTLVLPNLVS